MNSDNSTADQTLTGAVKNILDDLAILDKRVTEELERGVREGYLTMDQVPAIARKLGVKEPRIRTQRWVYVERRTIHSIAVNAYDDEEAERMVRTDYGLYLRRGEIPANWRQSRWAGDTRSRQIVSRPTAQRPRMGHNLPFYLEGSANPRPISRVDVDPS